MFPAKFPLSAFLNVSFLVGGPLASVFSVYSCSIRVNLSLFVVKPYFFRAHFESAQPPPSPSAQKTPSPPLVRTFRAEIHRVYQSAQVAPHFSDDRPATRPRCRPVRPKYCVPPA